MGKLKEVDYDDTLVRDFVVGFCKKQFDMNLYSNSKTYKIDLLSTDDPLLGVEVEHGQWEGDYWKNDMYSLITKLSFRTINIPIRKIFYWLDYEGDTFNPSAEKNIFIRTNVNFTQVIVIRPEVIRDRKKVINTRFKPKNSNEMELWMSFKREHVETYNVNNGLFLLDKT